MAHATSRQEHAPGCDFRVHNTNGNIVLATRAEFYSAEGWVVTLALRRRERSLRRVDPLIALGWGLGELGTQVKLLSRQDPVWVYATIAVPEGLDPQQYAVRIGKMFVGKLDKYAVFSPARLMNGLSPFGMKVHVLPEGSEKNPLAASVTYTVLPDRTRIQVHLRESVLNGRLSAVQSQLTGWLFEDTAAQTSGWRTLSADTATAPDPRDAVYKEIAVPLTALIQG